MEAHIDTVIPRRIPSRRPSCETPSLSRLVDTLSSGLGSTPRGCGSFTAMCRCIRSVAYFRALVSQDADEYLQAAGMAMTFDVRSQDLALAEGEQARTSCVDKV